MLTWALRLNFWVLVLWQRKVSDRMSESRKLCAGSCMKLLHWVFSNAAHFISGTNELATTVRIRVQSTFLPFWKPSSMTPTWHTVSGPYHWRGFAANRVRVGGHNLLFFRTHHLIGVVTLPFALNCSTSQEYQFNLPWEIGRSGTAGKILNRIRKRWKHGMKLGRTAPRMLLLGFWYYLFNPSHSGLLWRLGPLWHKMMVVQDGDKTSPLNLWRQQRHTSITLPESWDRFLWCDWDLLTPPPSPFTHSSLELDKMSRCTSLLWGWTS